MTPWPEYLQRIVETERAHPGSLEWRDAAWEDSEGRLPDDPGYVGLYARRAREEQRRRWAEHERRVRVGQRRRIAPILGVVRRLARLAA